MKKLIYILFITVSSCINAQNNEATITNCVNSLRIKKDLIKITQAQKSRNYQNIKTLDSVANYIKIELEKVCNSTTFQKYQVNKTEYKNVIGSIGLKNSERIIIGAHYDVYGNQQGADDNASGLAGLLELARLLSKEKLNYRIDFVAYTLEEPPFFRTKQMGSYIHANYLYKNKISVKGMICLEMIGYYNDKKGSQKYPIPGMGLRYGNKADFITVVQNNKGELFSEQIALLMKKQNLIKANTFKGSSLLPGVDFSDHLNYWNFDYPAVMVTNTAFYRNKNYHTKSDTLETLDIEKMSAVIEQLYLVIKQLK